MIIDTRRYPTTARYLDALPRGLESYPECTARTDLHQSVGARFPQLRELRDVPEPLRKLFTGDYREEWMPEAWAGAIIMLVRDAALTSDEALRAWRHEETSKLFQKPLYRVVMMLMSPTLVIMGASKRWGTFHRGSTFTATPVQEIEGRKVAQATLTFPPRLFDATFADVAGATCRAALEASKAREPRVELARVTETSALYRASWKP